jgi:hypothetical protein
MYLGAWGDFHTCWNTLIRWKFYKSVILFIYSRDYRILYDLYIRDPARFHFSAIWSFA